jgi:hypothetical protein
MGPLTKPPGIPAIPRHPLPAPRQPPDIPGICGTSPGFCTVFLSIGMNNYSLPGAFLIINFCCFYLSAYDL